MITPCNVIIKECDMYLQSQLYLLIHEDKPHAYFHFYCFLNTVYLSSHHWNDHAHESHDEHDCFHSHDVYDYCNCDDDDDGHLYV